MLVCVCLSNGEDKPDGLTLDPDDSSTRLLRVLFLDLFTRYE